MPTTSTRHRAGCRHCRSVQDYRLARHAAELAREQVTAGYAVEIGLHAPLITFRDWLVAMAGERQAA